MSGSIWICLRWGCPVIPWCDDNTGDGRDAVTARDGTLVDIREERFKAGILYSPVPIRHLTDTDPEDLYGKINMPLFHMTGTDDDSPLEGFGYEHRLVCMNMRVIPSSI